ncbi:unnamed protein product [Cylicocyclus nassatus]|uniref:Uncharacterized protein n=1 Tax=Cylicocyclus nassatus TaxID=53992 RepID=A0AA36GN99_CYLNA|nr:unnamed protein product [Cylicocyclus nassatus]
MRLLELSITMTYSICFFIIFTKVCLTCSKKKSAGRQGGDKKNQGRIGGGSKEKLAAKRRKSIDFTKMKEEQPTQEEEISPKRTPLSKEHDSVQQKIISKENCSGEQKASASRDSAEVLGSKEANQKPQQAGAVKNERDEHMGGYLSAGPDDRAFTLLMPVVPMKEETEGKSMFGEVIDPLKEKDKSQWNQQENAVDVEP